VIEGSIAKNVTKNGKTCLQHYSLKSGVARMTNLEIMQNYTEGLPAAGMTITNTDRHVDDDIYATVTKNGVESWVHVWASNGDGLHVLVLQIAPFRSSLAPAGDKDCPLVPSLENFTASAPPQTRTYDAQDFRVIEGSAPKNVAKNGKTCLQHYSLKSGAARMTNLEIIRNYAEALPAGGLDITNTDRHDDDEIYATMTKDGVESWVHVWPSNGDGLHVLVLQIAPFRSSLAPASDKDCPLVPSLENFTASAPPQTRTYDAQEFRVIEGSAAKNVTKNGKTCLQHYALKSDVARMTDLEIIRNYAEALPAAGLAITNTDRHDDDEIYATMTKEGVESWVHVWASNGDGLHVLLLQIAPFRSSLAPASDKDCPLVPSLENFTASAPPQTHTYDAQEFRVVEGNAAKNVTKNGKTCLQHYALRSGVARMTDLEIIRNYAEALPAAGLAITNTDRHDDDEIYATMTKDGVESWLHVWASNGDGLHVLLLQIEPFHSTMKAPQILEEQRPTVPPPPPAADLGFPAPAATPESVRAEQGDFPYLPSLPGSKFLGGRADPSPFFVQPADAKQPELVANGSIIKEYQPPPGMGLPQLLGAYHGALFKAHWTIVSEFHNSGVALSAHYGENGRNIWATLHLTDTAYGIAVADATIAQNRLAADLGSKCHLALTGVLFDFNKSTLKPESDAVLRQVAALMIADPALRLEIQGHTDNVGSDAYNQPLSETRARSVVMWLTQHNVPLSHMVPRGYGKTRPIVTNATDEGRAQNRRVEIANPACKG
jgi:outer membrane protein OmpA-like peptidoglycan-associated protein